jgi:hypothetical protein
MPGKYPGNIQKAGYPEKRVDLIDQVPDTIHTSFFVHQDIGTVNNMQNQ